MIKKDILMFLLFSMGLNTCLYAYSAQLCSVIESNILLLFIKLCIGMLWFLILKEFIEIFNNYTNQYNKVHIRELLKSKIVLYCFFIAEILYYWLMIYHKALLANGLSMQHCVTMLISVTPFIEEILFSPFLKYTDSANKIKEIIVRYTLWIIMHTSFILIYYTMLGYTGVIKKMISLLLVRGLSDLSTYKTNNEYFGYFTHCIMNSLAIFKFNPFGI